MNFFDTYLKEFEKNKVLAMNEDVSFTMSLTNSNPLDVAIQSHILPSDIFSGLEKILDHFKNAINYDEFAPFILPKEILPTLLFNAIVSVYEHSHNVKYVLVTHFKDGKHNVTDFTVESLDLPSKNTSIRLFHNK